MTRIQEIAEELVNLTIKEVNKLSIILKNCREPMRYDFNKHNYKVKLSLPKYYGQRKTYNRRHK